MKLEILNDLIEKLSLVKEIRLIALYGSFARGDYGPKSDIDLFILTSKDRLVKNRVEDIIIKNTRDLGRGVTSAIRSTDELKKMDEGFLDNILREGKILYSKLLDLDVSKALKLTPYIIYQFGIRHLDQRTKRKFNLALYGTKTKKYEYKGILSAATGKKLARGCILIPENKKEQIDTLFKNYKIKPESIRVWGF